MTNGFASIITTLEQRKTAIERALASLREVDGTMESAATGQPGASPRNGRKRSAAVRRRMQEAQRLRWAKVKGKSEPAAPVTRKAPKRKISAEGLKRIVAATKKRWARVRAEAKAALEQTEAKKAARKKLAAPAKAVRKSAPVKKAGPVKTVPKKKSAATKTGPAAVPAVTAATAAEQV